MFYADAFDYDIGKWDMDKVTTMAYMFSHASASFKAIYPGLQKETDQTDRRRSKKKNK